MGQEEGGRKRRDVFTYLKPVLRNHRNMREDNTVLNKNSNLKYKID